MPSGRKIAWNMVSASRWQTPETHRGYSATIDFGLPGAAATGYAVDILATSGLAGYWRMDASSGTSETDVSPTAANLAYTGSPVLVQAGAILADPDTAVNFNGAGHASVAHQSAWDGTGFTFECWIKINGNAADATYIASRNNSWEMLMAGDLLHFYMGGPNSYMLGDVHLGDNAWHHVAFGFDPGTNIRFTYIDGVLAKHQTETTPYSNTSDGMKVASAWGGSNQFASLMDEVALYNRALAGAEIAAHYARGTSGVAPAPEQDSVPGFRMTASNGVDADTVEDSDTLKQAKNNFRTFLFTK